MAYFDFEPEERCRPTWAPVLDVSENAAEIVVRVELPDVDKSGIRLAWKNDVLTISGIKQRQPREQGQLRYICVERQYGPFRRDIAVGAAVDFTKATARLANGLLQIRLPKTREMAGDSIPID